MTRSFALAVRFRFRFRFCVVANEFATRKKKKIVQKVFTILARLVRMEAAISLLSILSIRKAWENWFNSAVSCSLRSKFWSSWRSQKCGASFISNWKFLKFWEHAERKKSCNRLWQIICWSLVLNFLVRIFSFAILSSSSSSNMLGSGFCACLLQKVWYANKASPFQQLIVEIFFFFSF